MADCSKIEAELQKALAEQAAIDKLKRQVDAEARITAEMRAEEAATGAKPFRTFSMVDGTKIRINPREFYRQVELDNIGLGEDKIRELVRARFDKDAKPDGSQGLNINYAEMDFNEENVNILLELAGQRRMKSAAGAELAMEFTEEVARDELLDNVRMMGGDAAEIARQMAQNSKGLKRLPVLMVMSKKMKFDSARYYADLLEDTSTLIETFGVSPAMQARLSRASQFMHFFEQYDALIARKVGQSLRARMFDPSIDVDGAVDGIDFGNIESLQLELLNEGSLAAQVSEAILQGNAEELRKIARAKRVGALNEVGLNDGRISVQVRILNNLRRDNMFLSPSTWVQRNVVAGALVNFTFGADDFMSMAFKRKDLGDAYRMAMFSLRNMQMGMGAAFGNAFEMLTTGKATFTQAGIKEGLDPRSLVNRKENNQQIMLKTRDDLNSLWEEVVEGNIAQKAGAVGEAAVDVPLSALTLMSTGARYLLGSVIEKLPGASTAGYSPGFSLLAAGDEVTRKMAFDWAASKTAYDNALTEWDQLVDKPEGISKAQWVADRANERVEAAVFAPEKMTADELAVIRRQAGGMQFGDMSDDALRLKLFNDQAGLPNLGTPEGRAGAQRGAEATFTQKITGSVGIGIQQIRQNPLGGWVMPVFQTPYNGLKWLLSRDFLIALPKQFIKETRQARGVADDLPFTADEMADARARTLNAAFISATTYALWQSGVFRDGGSFNPDQRRRENNPALGSPYSFAFSVGNVLGMSKISIPGASIDLVDLMGLQADVHRAFHENIINDTDVQDFMFSISQAYMRVLDNKSTLTGVQDILNMISRIRQGQNVDFTQVIAGQMNGTLPLSGFLTAASRGFQDLNEQQTFGRRQLSADEVEALGKDPNWNVFQKFAARVARNYPIIGTIGYQYQDKDWLMRDRRRPFGVPLDSTAPFAILMTSDTPLDQWMNKHGFGAKPRPEGKVGSSALGLPSGSAPTTMSMDEERTYRIEMNRIKGEVPVETILGRTNAVINTGVNVYNINQYTRGNTLLEALTALSEDPRYNADLALPYGPSIENSPLPIGDQSLAKRSQLINDPGGLYKVFDAIVDYYDRLGLTAMAQQHPEFVQKAIGNTQLRQKKALDNYESLAPLGLSRQ